MKPNNPFLISGYYSPEYFCNREQETQTITDALYNGRNLTLIAPRRMGKTGLIKHVFPRLKEPAGRYRHALHGHLLDAEPRRFRTAPRQYRTGAVGFCAAESIEPSVAVHQKLPSGLYVRRVDGHAESDYRDRSGSGRDYPQGDFRLPEIVG